MISRGAQKLDARPAAAAARDRRRHAHHAAAGGDARGGRRLQRGLRGDWRRHEADARSRRWRWRRGSSRSISRCSQRLVPKVERARGKRRGQRARHAARPARRRSRGELHAAGEELAVHGLPSAFTDMHVDLRASADRAARRAATPSSRGGPCRCVATVPVRGFEVGVAGLAHRGARACAWRRRTASPQPSTRTWMSATTPRPRAAEGSALPRVTGDVNIGSFAYTRPISLTTDLGLARDARQAHPGQTLRSRRSTSWPSTSTCARRRRSSSRTTWPRCSSAIDSGIARGHRDQPARSGCAATLKALPGGRFHFQSQRVRRAAGAHPLRGPDARGAERRRHRRHRVPALHGHERGRRGRRRVRRAGRRGRRSARRAAGRSGASRSTPSATPTTCAST